MVRSWSFHVKSNKVQPQCQHPQSQTPGISAHCATIIGVRVLTLWALQGDFVSNSGSLLFQKQGLRCLLGSELPWYGFTSCALLAHERNHAKLRLVLAKFAVFMSDSHLSRNLVFLWGCCPDPIPAKSKSPKSSLSSDKAGGFMISTDPFATDFSQPRSYCWIWWRNSNWTDSDTAGSEFE